MFYGDDLNTVILNCGTVMKCYSVRNGRGGGKHVNYNSLFFVDFQKYGLYKYEQLNMNNYMMCL